MFQIVHSVMFDLFWKLYENPFIHVFVMLLTVNQTRQQTNKDENKTFAVRWKW